MESLYSEYFYEDGFTQKSWILSHQVRTKPKSIETSLSRELGLVIPSFAISRGINYSLRFISNHFIHVIPLLIWIFYVFCFYIPSELFRKL